MQEPAEAAALLPAPTARADPEGLPSQPGSRNVQYLKGSCKILGDDRQWPSFEVITTYPLGRASETALSRGSVARRWYSPCRVV